MSSTGTTTWRSHDLCAGGATISTGAWPPRNRATSSVGRTVADSPIRWAGFGEQRVEPLEGDREVGATFRAGDRVHLVDDDRLDALQRLAGPAGQHEEQRLGGRDQDVGWSGREGTALVGRCVARADADPDVGQPGRPGGEPLRRLPDAGQRRPEVALDVDGQRLERGDVEHPGALGLVLRRRRGQQLVDRSQERAERLARAGRARPRECGGHSRSRPTRPPAQASARRTRPGTRSGSAR